MRTKENKNKGPVIGAYTKAMPLLVTLISSLFQHHWHHQSLYLSSELQIIHIKIRSSISLHGSYIRIMILTHMTFRFELNLTFEIEVEYRLYWNRNDSNFSHSDNF